MPIEPIITSMLSRGYKCEIYPNGCRSQVIFTPATTGPVGTVESISLSTAVELAAERVLENV